MKIPDKPVPPLNHACVGLSGYDEVHMQTPCLDDVSKQAYESVEGTTFRVVEGTIWALPPIQEAAREAYPVTEDGVDQWARKLAKFQSVKASEAQMRIARYDPTAQTPLPALPASLPGNLMGMTSGYGVHVQNMRGPDGKEVLLEVLSIGPKWAHLGLEIGQPRRRSDE